MKKRLRNNVSTVVTSHSVDDFGSSKIQFWRCKPLETKHRKRVSPLPPFGVGTNISSLL